ncbi:non-ribosomal peptide synthetase [Streptomyces eurythermus]|uniref:non-ribosomal peptide synthetase n=1 Tax=Streptomyces eurythermus TaxID=42237 RepID=UPI0036D4164B
MSLRNRIDRLDAAQLARLAETLPPLPASLRRLWTADRLAEGVPVYNVAEGFDLRGPLDPSRLRQALDRLWDRHAALRTVVAALPPGPYAVTLPADSPVPFDEVDLRSHGPAHARRLALEAARETAREPFDLEEGPLLRARLIRWDDEGWVFTVVLHHLVCDGASLRVLFGELAQLYATPDLLPLPRAAQTPPTGEGDSARRAADLAYWRNALHDIPRTPGLPVDRVRPPHSRQSGARTPLPLDADWYARVRKSAQTIGVSPFDVLLTAVGVVLGRFGGVEDIVVGTTVDARSETGDEDSVGFRMKTVPLRLRPRPSDTVAALARVVHETVLAAMTHTEAEFDEIVAAVGRPGPVHAPLFQVAVELHHDAGTLDLAGLRVEPLALDTGTSKFDLTFHVSSSPGSPGFLEYSTELYDAHTARGLGEALAAVLAELDQYLDLPLTDPPLTRTAGDRDPAGPRREPATVTGPGAEARPLPEALREAARRHPDRPALTCPTDGGTSSYSFRELREHTDALAALLGKAGVGRQQPVGVCMERSVAQASAAFGIWAADAVFVPLDPASPAERLTAMLDAAGIRTVLVDPGTEGHPALAGVRRIRGDVLSPAADRVTGTPAGPGGDDIAYVIFTSGTSGPPKPVAVRHRSLAALADAMRELAFHTLPDAAPVAVNAPPYFDASLQNLSLLADGHPVHLIPDSLRTDPHALVRYLADHRIHAVDGTPTHVASLVEAGLLDRPAEPVLTVVLGGEPVPPQLWRRLKDSPVRAYNVYGPTEFTVNATGCRIDDHPEPVIGRPLRGVTAEVLDERLRPVPAGFPGELHLSGIQSALGYRGRPAATAERFRPGPRGDVRYATGDRARYLANGTLAFLGRRDEQVKLRGHRIELGEVADSLRTAPGVVEAAAALVTAENGSPVLAGFLVTDGAGTDLAAVRAHAARQLPAAMIPAVLRLVDALPRTPNGKLDHAALAESVRRTAAAPPDGAVDADPREPVHPALAAIWQRLLGVTDVRPDDDFFALGGHSLLATRLIREVREHMGAGLSLQTVFRTRTLARMTAALPPAGPPPSTGQSPAPGRQDEDTALVVPLAEGGDGLPLVVLHPLGGTLFAYEPLLRLIPDSHPVWGIRSPSAAGADEDARDVHALVGRYADELLRTTSARRLAVYGWSLGGLLALALTAELERRGVDVVFTEAWDCGLSTANPLTDPDLAALAVRAVHGESTALSVKDRLAGLSGPLTPEHTGLLHLARSLAEPSRAEQDTAAFVRELSLIRAQTTLLRDWVPGPIRAPLHAVLAEKSLRTGAVTPSDWGTVTSAEWTVHTVDSDHHGMVRPPAVRTAAAGLLARLSTAAPSSRTTPEVEPNLATG